MKNIREFKTEKEVMMFIKENVIKKIASGYEGTAYLTKEGNVIKSMLYSDIPKKYNDDIIMSDDIKLDSFIFPNELFILNDIVVGYSEDYFKNNIFTFKGMDYIDIDKLSLARNKMIEDTKVLTDNGYYLYDIPGNILFDNNRLVAIDTLDYKKDNTITLNKNIEIIDYAILMLLSFKYPSIKVNNPYNEEIEKVLVR